MSEDQEWITVKDAAKLRQCAERTIIDKIHKGVLQGKKDGRRWLVLVDLSEIPAANLPQNAEDSGIISILKVELQERNDQVNKLQEQLEKMRQDAADASERSDTIILGLTQQNQLMLEDKRKPWYKKLFGKKEG